MIAKRFTRDKLDPPTADFSSFKVSSIGLDFSKNDERSKYAEELFTKNPPKLTTLSTKLLNLKIDHPKLQHLKNERFNMVIKIKAPDAYSCLKELIANNHVDIPVPSWIQTLSLQNSNHITLQETETTNSP